MTIKITKEVLQDEARAGAIKAHIAVLYAAFALSQPDPDQALRSLESLAHSSGIFNERKYEERGFSPEDSDRMVAELMANWGRPFKQAQTLISNSRNDDQGRQG